jgi:small-conductance mechanosensitive channel
MSYREAKIDEAADLRREVDKVRRESAAWEKLANQRADKIHALTSQTDGAVAFRILVGVVLVAHAFVLVVLGISALAERRLLGIAGWALGLALLWPLRRVMVGTWR